MNVWEFALIDSALVVLDEWSSYKGGLLNRFDCSKREKSILIIALAGSAGYPSTSIAVGGVAIFQIL